MTGWLRWRTLTRCAVKASRLTPSERRAVTSSSATVPAGHSRGTLPPTLLLLLLRSTVAAESSRGPTVRSSPHQSESTAAPRADDEAAAADGTSAGIEPPPPPGFRRASARIRRRSAGGAVDAACAAASSLGSNSPRGTVEAVSAAAGRGADPRREYGSRVLPNGQYAARDSRHTMRSNPCSQTVLQSRKAPSPRDSKYGSSGKHDANNE